MYFHLINIKFVDSFTLEIFLRVPNKANQLLHTRICRARNFDFDPELEILSFVLDT